VSISPGLGPVQPLDVRFTRAAPDRDRVEVTRADHSRLVWEFPTHVSRLPHDLGHLVVEEGLGIGLGFWGLVSRGMDVGLVDGHAELTLGGVPVRDHPEIDLDDLRHSEEAVAVLSPSGLRTEPVGALVVVTLEGRDEPARDLTDENVDRIIALFPDGSVERIRAVHDRLVSLDLRWAAVPPGGSITLPFDPRG
jgi:hypothetical protein